MFFYKQFNIVFVLTLTLLKLNSAVNSDKKQDAKCLLPMEPGPCRMSLNRFYYNANTDTCVEFKFGGCMGNDNKFGFKQTCEAACKKSTGAVPTSAPVTSSTTDATKSNTKPVAPDSLKPITDNSAAASTTNSKPGPVRTTAKTPTITSKGGTTTTTQKLK